MVVAATRTGYFRRFGPFRFDTVNRILLRDSEELPLPPRVLALLECLLERPGQVIARQELIDRVWRDAFVTDTSLAEAVSVLRQALGDDPQQPTYVQTLHRRGYRFVAEVHSDPPTVEAAAALDSVPVESEPSPAIRHIIPWTLVALLASTLVVALWKITHPPSSLQPQVARFEVSLPPGVALDPSSSSLALSHDGATIALVGCSAGVCRLYLRALNDLAAQPVEGSDGAASPFFSPDGAWVGFFAGSKLLKVSVSGGSPLALCDAPEPLGASWLPDGRIVFSSREGSGLEVVGENGGTPRAFTSPDLAGGEVGHRWPHWLPGSDFVTLTALTMPGDAASARAVVLSLSDGTMRTLSNRAAGVRLAAPDVLLFARDDELFAARFDENRSALATTPVRAAGGLTLATDGAPLFAVSARGAVLAASGRTGSTGLVLQRRSDAAPRPLELPLQRLSRAQLDPDGRRVAGILADGDRRDLWVGELSRGTAVRLTHGGRAAFPIWTLDGRSIVFSAAVPGPFNLWVADAGAGAARRLLRTSAHQYPTSALADRVIYTQLDPATKGDIWIALLHENAAGTAAPAPLVRTPFDERAGMVSPDGRWLAYESDESGGWQVYLRPMAGGTRTAVAPMPSSGARWIAPGLLAYRAGDRIYEVSVSDAGAVGPPRPLFDLRGARFVDLGADRALLFRPPAAGRSARIILTLEGREELARILPPAVSALPR